MEYPKMIYHEDGRTHILPTASAERPEGDWSDMPSDAHRSARSEHHFSIGIDTEETRDNEADRLADRVIGRLRAEGYTIIPPGGAPPDELPAADPDPVEEDGSGEEGRQIPSDPIDQQYRRGPGRPRKTIP